MRCIHCGKAASRRQRADRCRGCGHAFAFPPGRDPYGLTDADFHAALQDASTRGTHFFTARQLWYSLARPGWTRRTLWGRLAPWTPWAGGTGAVALGILDVVELNPLVLFVIGVVATFVAVLALELLLPGRPPPLPLPPRVPFDVFRGESLERWVAVHGPIAHLVPDPRPDAVPRAVPADVAAFSFDRVVVAQHAEIAAMLVANRLHFENGCAVLSLDGYPFGIADTVREMLRRNPRLTVFAVHDASAAGVALPFTLREPAWFPGPDTLIVDVLLSDAVPWGIPVLRDAPVKLPEHLRGEMASIANPGRLEAGNRAELAALAPADLLRIIQRAFTVTGLPGQPAYAEASRRAVETGGVVWASALMLPPAAAPAAAPVTFADTSPATDGFG
jgi:hypothetical protein